MRQALNQLCRDGLVTLEPARGAHVSMQSVEEARQVFELRQMIEGALIRRLCRTITDAQIAELRAHLKAERAAVSRTDVPGRTQVAERTTMAPVRPEQPKAVPPQVAATRTAPVDPVHTESVQVATPEPVQTPEPAAKREPVAAVPSFRWPVTGHITVNSGKVKRAR